MEEVNDLTYSDDEQTLGPTRKRQKVSVSGYESDSSDDENNGSNPISSLRYEPKVSDSVHEEDMFAVDENKQSSVIPDKDYEHDQYDEETIENSPETHLPEDGDIKVEAFNVDEEREKGYFDEAGNYIPADEQEDEATQDQDLWIDDVKDTQKVATAQKNAESKRRIENRKAQQSSRHFMIDEALLRFYFFLPHDGTIVDSLARLNKSRKAGGRDITNSINYITELINILEQKAVEDVYSLKRVAVAALYAEECLSDSALIDHYKSLVWDFRWLKEPSKVHGPFSSYQMQSWKRSYFRDNVAVRFADDPDKPENWLDINSITFM